MRWRLVSSAVPAVREIEEISISKGEKGRLRLDIRKKKCSQFGWTDIVMGCPGRWSHHPWRSLRGVWVWRWLMWFRGYRGRAGLVVGLDDHESLF